MTEAGVAWQQYDLSDSDADDADVKRSQVGKSKIGGVGGTNYPASQQNMCFFKDTRN